MSVQPRHPAIAVPERVNPRQPVVRSRNRQHLKGEGSAPGSKGCDFDGIAKSLSPFSIYQYVSTFLRL
jgi:hypothetical protein